MAPAGPEFELVKFKFQFILGFSRSLITGLRLSTETANYPLFAAFSFFCVSL